MFRGYLVLSEFEYDFLDSVGKRLEWRTLTDKQESTLEKIYKKY